MNEVNRKHIVDKLNRSLAETEEKKPYAVTPVHHFSDSQLGGIANTRHPAPTPVSDKVVNYGTVFIVLFAIGAVCWVFASALGAWKGHQNMETVQDNLELAAQVGQAEKLFCGGRE